MTAIPTTPEPSISQPFRLPPPLVAPAGQRARQGRQITPTRSYVVRAELDQALDPRQQDEVADLLAGHQVRIGVSPGGRTGIQLVLPGRDLWQSILEAMVTLTNARCALTAISIVEARGHDRLPRPSPHHPRAPRQPSS